MTFERIVLVLGGLGFAVFGVGFAFAPEGMAGLIHLGVDHPTARTDVRAVYGGLEIGVAIFLLWSAAAPHRIRGGLVALVSCFGAILAGRLLGVVLDDSVDPQTLIAVALELGGTVLGTVALARPGTEVSR